MVIDEYEVAHVDDHKHQYETISIKVFGDDFKIAYTQDKCECGLIKNIKLAQFKEYERNIVIVKGFANIKGKET